MDFSNYLPTSFNFAIGGCFGPSFTVRLSGDKLVYEKSSGLYSTAPTVDIIPTPDKWEHFWRQMDEIDIWHWEREYGKAIDDHHEEGVHWYVQITCGERSVVSEGDNRFPGETLMGSSREFDKFLTALSGLLGGVELW